MGSSARPRVAVVMPMYNAAAFLEEALASILTQTFEDFELLVVDDGSHDAGPAIVEAVQDDRLRLIRIGANVGIARALNTGIEASGAPLIARMDADDVSAPGRLAAQVAFLDAHPEIGIVGCQPQLIDERGSELSIFPLLTRDQDLRAMLRLQGPFCHGAVMFRREVVTHAGGYRTEEQPAEDYGLWLRMAACSQLANLDEPLYKLRISGGSVSATSATAQVRRKLELQRLARSGGVTQPTWRELRSGRRHYRSIDRGRPPDLVARYCGQYQELALVDLIEEGWAVLPSVVRALALGPLQPRHTARLLRFYRRERSERRSNAL